MKVSELTAILHGLWDKYGDVEVFVDDFGQEGKVLVTTYPNQTPAPTIVIGVDLYDN